ncbi:MAG: dTDP-4-amino-4,6-dideoxygalactose transaminase [bacterium]
MIPFNVPCLTNNEIKYINEVFSHKSLSGDGDFTKRCNKWFEDNFGCQKILLTTSCTHSLEMSAILANISKDDEVIMPSFTFVSTANAFVLRGAKIVFVDIRPDTMNINEKLIEAAVTERTKAIIPVHYAGIACDMDIINDIASRHNLIVIEDAAQAVMSKYKGKPLGTIGNMGCYSFHETKNYNCGEGGAILLNNAELFEKAEIIREKGTNRSRYLRGQVDKYSWVDVGSSYLPSEINAACLYAQMEKAEEINNNRIQTWNIYNNSLKSLEEKGLIELPKVPDYCQHNGHLFYIKTKDLEERTQLIDYLKQNNITPAFHYVPLHSSEAGVQYGRFHGEDQYTTKDSERLLRLPLYYGIEIQDVNFIVDSIRKFYVKSKFTLKNEVLNFS